MSEPILWCTACGASTTVVNKTTHERNCRRGPVTWTPINPHKPVVTHEPTSDEPITHSVTHNVTHEPAPTPEASTAKSSAAERQARYRAKLGDTYRDGNRERMRRNRATEKTATPV